MRPRDLKVAGVVGIGAEAGSSWGSGDGLDVDASSGDGILGGGLTVEGEVASSEDGKYRRDARTHGRLPTFSMPGRLLLDHTARMPDRWPSTSVIK